METADQRLEDIWYQEYYNFISRGMVSQLRSRAKKDYSSDYLHPVGPMQNTININSPCYKVPSEIKVEQSLKDKAKTIAHSLNYGAVYDTGVLSKALLDLVEEVNRLEGVVKSKDATLDYYKARLNGSYGINHLTYDPRLYGPRQPQYNQQTQGYVDKGHKWPY